MDADEVQSILEERRQEFEECTTEDALSTPVDTDRFYRFIASIKNVEVHDENHISVSFDEPVPGATTLDPGYTYTISVASENKDFGRTREKMPKEELLTLQQTAIIIWSIVTGQIYRP